jgi:hypothetical protein
MTIVPCRRTGLGLILKVFEKCEYAYRKEFVDRCLSMVGNA